VEGGREAAVRATPRPRRLLSPPPSLPPFAAAAIELIGPRAISRLRCRLGPCRTTRQIDKSRTALAGTFYQRAVALSTADFARIPG
jgi:hypothetical protein